MNDYTKYDAVGLAELVARGEVTPRELLEHAFERADALNPQLNAIVAFDRERALDAADQLAKPAPSVSERPSLCGVPFLLKDLYADAVGHAVTNGCRLFADQVCDHDSVLVERYRQAGLLIFGRSASPELGLTTSTESTLHGQTKNPWSAEHTAGGSSGGAASAVAAGIVPAAHASDGGGSIRIPASCCGLFGLKPTRARVSVAPDKGEGWAGLSTNHAVTRSVRDSAALLDIVEGPALGDPYCAPAKERPYLEEVRAPVGALRIAFTTTAFNGAEVDAECRTAVERAAKLCADAGHHLEERTVAISSERMTEAASIVVGANVRASLDDRASALGRKLRQDDVEPLTWAIARGAERWGSADYARAVSTIHRIGAELAGFFVDSDLLLTPTMASVPPLLGELALTREDRSAYLECLGRTIGFTQLMNVAGNPAMSLPLHWTPENLPVGVQFAAAVGGEPILFRLAAQIEQAQPWFDRRPP